MTVEEARGHMERRELTVVRTPADDLLDPEYGEITNVNDCYVFVRWRGSEGSRPADPAELRSLAGKVRGNG